MSKTEKLDGTKPHYSHFHDDEPILGEDSAKIFKKIKKEMTKFHPKIGTLIVYGTAGEQADFKKTFNE